MELDWIWKKKLLRDVVVVVVVNIVYNYFYFFIYFLKLYNVLVVCFFDGFVGFCWWVVGSKEDD